MKQIILTIIAIMATATAGAQTDSLATYMRVAAQNNPQVQAQWSAYQSAMEAVCPAGTLNDPTLNVGLYPKAMELVNGKQVATFSLMQMFPWPGTMKAAKTEKLWQAKALYQKYRESGIDIAWQVEQQWYNILATNEQVSAIRQNIDIIHRIQEQAIYKYKSPSGKKMGANMSDQLRLESQEVSLQEQLESALSRLGLQKQQLNLLMHRDPQSPLVLPDSIVLREMPVVQLSDVESSSPQLNALKAQAESASAMGEKARKMGMPMVGVGVQYMLNKKTDMPRMEDMNGMDMWMPMLSVSLPVYRHKVKAQQRQAQLMRQGVEQSYERQLDQIESQILSIQQRADDVQRKIRLYNRQLELLSNTLDLMQAEYAVGGTSVTDILSTNRQQVDYALKKAEAKAKYNMIVAELEKLAAVNDYSSL